MIQALPRRRAKAALAYALGLTRGVLSDVLDGGFSQEPVKRILDATIMRHIAESIRLSEAGLEIDTTLLSEAEKHRLQGYDIA